VAFQLQPIVAFGGSRLRASGLLPVVLLRWILDLWAWLVLMFEDAPSTDPKEVDARRPEYTKILSSGLGPFFEPRRQTCPLCDAGDLQRAVRVGDLLQGKPGRFTMDRCRACAHVFQNPRLSLAGLDFYYKDFYDGLGGDEIEAIFGASLMQYHQRAEAVQAVTTPSKWLDVGGGHGHLCRILRDRMPDARFDALDLSESIEDAERRGWADRGYRGLFPDLADQLRARYDVVSMSHYLEHTREPEAEIEAAEKTLSEGGILMIEVPDPDCPFARVLGRLWLPYFQPQHQHLLSTKNLERLLTRHGFTPLVWHRGRAHQRIDFLAATILFFNKLAPKGDVPWQERSLARRVFRNFVFVAGFPCLIAARTVDTMIGPFAERFDWSNTYRVVARKGAR
jgi:SAM-dependent methyltransferase